MRQPISFQFFDWLWRLRPLSYPRDLIRHLERKMQDAYFYQNPNYDGDNDDESNEPKQHES
jgi:hypothetical protein